MASTNWRRSNSISSKPDPETRLIKCCYHTIWGSSSLDSTYYILLQTDLVMDGQPCRTYRCFWPVWLTRVRGLVETWDTACRRSLRPDAGFAGPGSFREPWSDGNFRHPGYSEGPDQTCHLNLEGGGDESFRIRGKVTAERQRLRQLTSVLAASVYLVCVQLWRTEQAFRGRGEGQRREASLPDKSNCRLRHCAQHVQHDLMGKDKWWPIEAKQSSFIISTS